MSERPVTLQRYIPAWDLLDICPFCFKVEVYLKLAGIPYTTVLSDPRKAPKRKLPVLLDDSETIPDSVAIVEHLERTRGRPLDAFLSVRQRALAIAVRSMIEEHLDFVVLYQRWQLDQNWALYKTKFIELAMQLGTPRFIARLAMPLLRRRVLRVLDSQGLGRHKPDEVVASALQLFESLAELCEGPYFFGAQPSTLDATVYAFLQSFAGVPFEGPVKDYVCTNDKLRRYREHVKARLAGHHAHA
jgi:glutathione S-transferase